MKKLQYIFKINFIKSLYINFKYFKLSGIKMPILIGWNVKWDDQSNNGIIFSDDFVPCFGTIKFGITEGSFSMGKGKNCLLRVKKNGKLLLSNGLSFNKDFFINVENNAIIIFKKNVSSNFHFVISSSQKITISEGVIIGWNTTIIDGDGHRILLNGEQINSAKEIVIGKHVWLGTNILLLKGAKIGDNCIVGANTVVSKNFFNVQNCILLGDPCKIVKDNIVWEI